MAESPEQVPYTLAELARKWKVSRRTIEREVVRGNLPYFRVGRQIRVWREDAEAYTKLKAEAAR